MVEIPSFVAIDLGTRDYAWCLALQRRLAAARADGAGVDTLLLVEHPAVITLGRRRTSRDHVIAPGAVPVIEVERGGDVTWHGPGQLVGYPIFALAPDERDVHRVLREIERALIDVLAALGLPAGRREGHTGVWCDGRKLASIGVAVSRWVTCHGFALNVAPDLSEFRRIQPCGLSPGVMGSIASLGVAPPPHADLVASLAAAIGARFGRRLTDVRVEPAEG
ncbi:MAG: octanoyltransferase [Deltaproteobacteria bacterium HGW-Deltaproteobacteria-14]|nr:MAG: octanoyltransferase [Deltaproteobacteria bacterium HGW-Deltaproteobacteria-14]